MTARFESIEPSTEAGADRNQRSDRLADRYPPRLLSTHLMRIFGVHKSRFYQLLLAGKFDRFELKPTIGRRAWSRTLVQRYLDGEAGSSRFGRLT